MVVPTSLELLTIISPYLFWLVISSAVSQIRAMTGWSKWAGRFLFRGGGFGRCLKNLLFLGYMNPRFNMLMMSRLTRMTGNDHTRNWAGS